MDAIIIRIVSLVVRRDAAAFFGCLFWGIISCQRALPGKVMGGEVWWTGERLGSDTLVM